MKAMKANGHYMLEASCARCGRKDWLNVMSIVQKGDYIEMRVHCPYTACQANFTITMDKTLWREIKEE